MTTHKMTPHDIDRVARHLVDADPPAGLEARITARLDALDAATPRPRWTWWSLMSWRVAAPLAGAALVAVLVWPTIGPGRHDRPVNPVAVPDTPAAQNAAARTDAADTRPSVGGDTATATPTSLPAADVGTDDRPVIRLARAEPTANLPEEATLDPREVALLAEEAAWRERRIPSLKTVEVLQVTELAFDPLNSSGSTQPEPLSITPLIMTTLPMEPTKSGGTRDH